jgi:hypothetical protein
MKLRVKAGQRHVRIERGSDGKRRRAAYEGGGEFDGSEQELAAFSDKLIRVEDEGAEPKPPIRKPAKAKADGDQQA